MESEMAVEEKRDAGENPYQSPTMTDLPPMNRCRWRQADIPLPILGILLVLGILQYWGIPLLIMYGFVHDISPVVAFAVYFVHWSSVGGLIGFAVSKKRGRGIFVGAIVGLILSAVLMC
jgi:hypothetical protein